MIEIHPIRTAAERTQFIMFPFKLYKGNEYWVAPLINDMKNMLNPQKNAYFEHSEAQLFTAWKDGKMVGTISAHSNTQHNKAHNDNVGFFGFFECIDDQEVAAALLDAASSWLREKGFDTMRGPANFSVNDTVGLLIDSFDASPYVLMPYNLPYYQELLENYGLTKVMDLYSYYLPVRKPPQRLSKLAEKLQKRGNFTIRDLDTSTKKNLKKDLAILLDVYRKAWQNNWGEVPLTDKEFAATITAMMPVIRSEFVYIAEVDGTAVGICATVPDFNWLLKKLKGRITPWGLIQYLRLKNRIPRLRVTVMGVMQEYHSRGIDVAFYHRIYQAAWERRHIYKEAELSWILENNTMMNRINTTLKARINKTYRLYDIDLDQ